MNRLLFFLLLCVSCNQHSKINAKQEVKEYPAKTVRIIEPFGSGGGPDIIARTISPALSQLWNQSVTVENHPGNGSTVAPALVAKAPADGYTLLINTSAQAYSVAFSNKLPYDPLKDFIPVVALTTQPYVLVTGKLSGIKTITDLITVAKKNELKFGSTGIGTGTHIGLEKFNLKAGIKATHVPAKQNESIREVIANTIAGHLTYILAPIQLAMKDIQSGNLTALGVTTRTRSNLIPHVPTIEEAGVADYDYPVWYGIWAPAATPEEIIDKLSKDITFILSTPAVQDSLKRDGATMINMTRSEFEKFILSESEMATKLVASTSLKN